VTDGHGVVVPGRHAGWSVGASWQRRVLLASLCLALVLGYSIAIRLPVSAGWENSWIENSQALVLLGGGLAAMCFAMAGGRKRRTSAAHAFGILAALTWFLMIARELSWGAALGTAVVVMPDGPFYSSSVLWYHDAIRPLVGLCATFALFLIVRFRLDRLVWQLVRHRNVPSAECTILLIAALGSTYADGHLLGLPVEQVFLGHDVVFEEWMELVGYMALVLAQQHVFASLGRLPGALTGPSSR
jgi:hypothetical protein